MSVSSAFWLGAGWKMNCLLAEALHYAEAVQAAAPVADRLQRFLLPPFTVLRDVVRALDGSPIRVGAQNLHWDDNGAWTGEISGPMLADCGVSLVEIGHSERRQNFGETDGSVRSKVTAARRHGLLPLVCIGETAQERAAGHAEQTLCRQVDAALDGLPDAGASDRGDPPLLLAYEPVWAIGAQGRPATPDQVEAGHRIIKSRVGDRLGRTVPCLYGGGVDAGNARELVACVGVDGLFVGRAAWSVEGFLELGRICSDALDRASIGQNGLQEEGT